jgi:acid phosphatase family membrane protein YuiD
MGFFEIIFNDVLIVSMAAWFVAQVAKIVINAIVNKTFDLERLFGDGGMPSGHSATVTATALMVGIHEGFASPMFGLALIFAIVVMHDATGVRQEAGKHAKTIIELTELFNEYLAEHDEKVKLDKLKILVGHTPLQVLFGALTGMMVVVLYLLIFQKFDLLLAFIPHLA